MKILYYLDDLNRGGVEIIVTQLAKFFIDNGNEVHIAYHYQDMHELKDVLPSNIILHPFPFNHNKKPYLQYFIYYPKLIRLLKNIKPDIIHAHNSSFSYFFLATGVYLVKLRTVNIRTLHFMGLFLERKSLFDKLRFYFDKKASALLHATIVSVSPIIQKIVEEDYAKNREKLIINGIDINKITKIKSTKPELGICNNSFVCVYTARICEGKNHKTLLEAWIKVVEAYPQALLVLIGDGTLKEECDKFCIDNGIKDNVYFTGSISNVAEFLSVADIGIFPSESEGLGLGLLEMMAAGLPVIVSDIPTFRSFINDGVNGVFFETYSSEDLSYKIIRLLSDCKKREIIGNNAFRFVVDNFALEAMLNAYKDLYQEELNLKFIKNRSNGDSNVCV